jgi:lambda family phage portal protein
MGKKTKQSKQVEVELRQVQALRRAVAIEYLRAFEAGKKSRRTENWYTNSLGPNADMRRVLHAIVRRHQDLVDSDPWASKAVSVVVNNWVGDGIIGAPFNATKRFADGWRDWSESIDCDWDGLGNFYAKQSLIARTVAVRGSCLVRRRIDESMLSQGMVPLKLQVLEPDYLDVSKDDGAKIRFGKQYLDDGRLEGYWIRRAHPGESDWTANSSISDLVPASEICHVYDVRRPGQATGVPFGVSALLKLRDVSDTDAAQLLKDKLAACFMAFIREPDAEEYMQRLNAKPPDPDNPYPEMPALLDKMEPGAMEILKPGQDVTFATPPSSGDFVANQKFHLLSIAQAYEITYESLTGDLSNVNFSSGRMGRMDMRQSVARWRWAIMIPQLLNRVSQWYRDAAAISGAGRVTARFEWTPPVAWLIDPAREIPAYVDAVRAGFMSLSEIQRMLGYVPEMVIRELGQDLDRARAAGIKLDVDLAMGPGSVRPVPNDQPLQQPLR